LKRILTLFSPLFFIFFFSCNGNSSNGDYAVENNIKTVTVGQTTIALSLSTKEWEEQMRKTPGTIIDIRTPDEWKTGYIEGAQFANIFDEDFLYQVNEIQENKNDAIFVYCRSGNRSKHAIAQLQENGYTQIYELNSGIIDWIENDKTIVK
jgi:rhodanese-related sulfurtransferase